MRAVARQVHVKLVDDLDGSQASETVVFGLDGRHYEVDLSEENAARLRDGLSRFVQAARRQRHQRDLVERRTAWAAAH